MAEALSSSLWVTNPLATTMFRIPSSAVLSCPREGSQCRFEPSMFDTVRGGLVDRVETERQGSLWTVGATDLESKALHLLGCQHSSGDCFVRCFSECECLLSHGEPCPEVVLAPLIVDETADPFSSRTLSEDINNTTTLAFTGEDFPCAPNIFSQQLVCTSQNRVTASTGEYADLDISVTCNNDAEHFRSASGCTCELSVTNDANQTLSGCSCSVCPLGYGENPITIDCPNDNIVAECSSIDCDNTCNGSCQSDCTLSGEDCPLSCDTLPETNGTDTTATTNAPTVTPPGATNNATSLAPTPAPTALPNSTLGDNITVTMTPTPSPTGTLTNDTETLVPTEAPTMVLNGTDPSGTNDTETLVPTMAPINTTYDDTNQTMTPTMAPNTTYNDMNQTMAPSMAPNTTYNETNQTMAPSMAPNTTYDDTNQTMAPTMAPNGNATTAPTVETNATVPNVNETLSPTLSPNATNAPTLTMPNETLAPTMSATTEPNMTAGVNETYTPTLSPVMKSNATEDANETLAPTLAPASGTNETHAPTMSPSVLSNETTMSPTLELANQTNETSTPMSSNATPPLIDESDTVPPSTFEPTASPSAGGPAVGKLTAAPTKVEDGPDTLDPSTQTQSHIYTGVSMYLSGMESMSRAARAAFESATEDYYRSNVMSSIGSSSVLRRLQEVTSFDTKVTVKGEQVDNGGDTVIYDQVLYFTTSDGANVDESLAMDALVGPLSTESGKQAYLAFLKNSSQDFQDVTSVGTPSVSDGDPNRSTPPTTSEDDSGGISNVVLIILIAFGVLACCCCVVAIGLVMFNKAADDGKQKNYADDDPDVMNDPEDGYNDYDGDYGIGPAIPHTREQDEPDDTFHDEGDARPNASLENWVTSSPKQGPVDEFSTMGPAENNMGEPFRGSFIGGGNDGRRRSDLEFGDDGSDGSSSSGYMSNGDDESMGLDSRSRSSDFDSRSGSESGGEEDEEDDDSSSEGEYSNSGVDATDWGLA